MAGPWCGARAGQPSARARIAWIAD